MLYFQHCLMGYGVAIWPVIWPIFLSKFALRRVTPFRQAYASVALDAHFATVGSRADIVRSAMAPNPHDATNKPLERGPSDLSDHGLDIIPGQPTQGIKVKTRDFR